MKRPNEAKINNEVNEWYAKNTFHHSEFKKEELVLLKGSQKISVVIPTLNEENTIGKVVRTIRKKLMDEVSLVDEIIVVDSDSSDNTKEEAEKEGAKFFVAGKKFKESFIHHGKGENMWLSLFFAEGDIIVWIDADIENIEEHFVTGLIGPLLKKKDLMFVKSFYERPIKMGESIYPCGGGRVTEICVRPMFNHYFRELVGFVQPLSGEYAGRRALLEQLPFYLGYGVETGMLIDILNNFGLSVMAQVDLDVRVHRNHSTIALGKMAFGIQQVFIEKINERFGSDITGSTNYSFHLRSDNNSKIETVSKQELKRPPIIHFKEYREKFHMGCEADDIKKDERSESRVCEAIER